MGTPFDMVNVGVMGRLIFMRLVRGLMFRLMVRHMVILRVKLMGKLKGKLKGKEHVESIPEFDRERAWIQSTRSN